MQSRRLTWKRDFADFTRGRIQPPPTVQFQLPELIAPERLSGHRTILPALLEAPSCLHKPRGNLLSSHRLSITCRKISVSIVGHKETSESLWGCSQYARPFFCLWDTEASQPHPISVISLKSVQTILHPSSEDTPPSCLPSWIMCWRYIPKTPLLPTWTRDGRGSNL